MMPHFRQVRMSNIYMYIYWSANLYYRHQTRTRTASWHASLVGTCALYSHTKWPTYCSHTMQEAVYLCNRTVSRKSTHTIVLTFVVCWVCDMVFRMKRRSKGEMLINGHTHTDRSNYLNPRCACALRVNKHCKLIDNLSYRKVQLSSPLTCNQNIWTLQTWA